MLDGLTISWSAKNSEAGIIERQGGPATLCFCQVPPAGRTPTEVGGCPKLLAEFSIPSFTSSSLGAAHVWLSLPPSFGTPFPHASLHLPETNEVSLESSLCQATKPRPLPCPLPGEDSQTLPNGLIFCRQTTVGLPTWGPGRAEEHRSFASPSLDPVLLCTWPMVAPRPRSGSVSL